MMAWSNNVIHELHHELRKTVFAHICISSVRWCMCNKFHYINLASTSNRISFKNQADYISLYTFFRKYYFIVTYKKIIFPEESVEWNVVSHSTLSSGNIILSWHTKLWYQPAIAYSNHMYLLQLDYCSWYIRKLSKCSLL